MKCACFNHVVCNDKKFFIGDSVSVKTNDGGGRTGVVSHITSKGLYLNVGNKRDTHFNFNDISEINEMYRVITIGLL